MHDSVNIHTHLIPGMIWLRDHLPKVSTEPEDLPSLIFTSSALLCLFASALWHTMSGCADRTRMMLCARVDYVGIGWLISASVGTVVHYGFYCHETSRDFFLSLCAASAVLGTVFPFMEWFDKFEYRVSGFCPSAYFRVKLDMVIIYSCTGLRFLSDWRSQPWPLWLLWLVCTGFGR